MNRKSNWVKYTRTLLIIIILSSSVIFVFEAEMRQKLHSWSLYHKRKVFRVILLVNNLTENSISNSSSIKAYNTLCTLGLAKQIEYILSETGYQYEFIYYETDKQEALNKTYLDSFDLIVVGGITYWWIFASNQDKEALVSTEKPIISSASLGLNRTPALNNLVGVYHRSRSDYEAWRAVLPVNETLITYVGVKDLGDKSTVSKTHLIQGLSLTTKSKLYAYAEREGKRYPYIVFNGTKNYHINTYTYEGNEQIRFDIAFILDIMFDLFENEYLVIKIWGASRKTVANILVILMATFFSVIIGLNAIKYELPGEKRIKIRIEMEKLQKTICITTLTLLLIMFALFIFKTYALPFYIDGYVSTECLVIINCILIALTSILLSRKGNVQ